MARPSITTFAALVLLLTWTAMCAGQGPAVGTPAFGSVGGGPFDTIDLGNLNVHFAVPIRSKAGRGIPFSYNLTYDSSIWYPGTVNGVATWQPTTQAGYWGWFGLTTQGAISNLTYSIQMTSGNCGQTGQYTWQQWQYKNFVYYDNQGSHNNNYTAYWIQTTGPPSVCPPSGAQPPTAPPVQFTDGSGLTLHALPTGSNSLTWNVTTTSGTTFNNSAGGVATTDANGNQITVSSGVVTDTLAQTALTIAGVAPSNTTLQYAAPSGATATYTVIYKAYTVKTSFGCSGIAEYNLSQNLVDKITLPDATVYQFAYEPTAGGTTGQVTGRLTSVTLPTGGSITYSYPTKNSGANNSINCSDGSVAAAVGTTPSVTRVVTPGGTSTTGTWKYFRTQVSGNHWQTTITDPTTAANQTLIDFQKDASGGTVNFYETERQGYQGSVGGTVLSTNFSCYNTVNPTPANCPTTSVSTPITRVTAFTCLPNCSGKEAKTDTQYGYISSPAFPTEVDSFDYGTGAAGSTLQKVITAYNAFGNTVRATSVQVQDGSSNIISRSTYSYDQTTPQTTIGTLQHINVTGGRGNLTTLQRQTISTPATSLYQVLSYYDTGNIYQVTDSGLTNTGGTNLTTYTYGACNNSFATSISEPLGLSESFTWDCNGGVATSFTDENNATSHTYYTGTNCLKSADANYWRPYASADQLGNCTTYNYPSLTVAESTLAFNGSASVVDKRLTFDGFGSPNITQTEQGFNVSTYDSVETDYDEIGRAKKTTIPYSGTAGAICSGCVGTISTYDPLSRTSSVTDAGGGSLSYTYTKNDTYQDISAPAPENDKRKQLEYDGLGRLSSVCEVATGGPAVCGQTNNVYTGYWTLYTYDALGDMTGVNENSQGTNQTRSYGFDMLGRMISEQNPESGSGTYTYDTSDATCGTYTSAGDLVEKRDAVGNYTCIQYDGLHRITQITYPAGTYASRTPTKCFKYGAISVGSGTMQNANLRPAEAFTSSASSCSGSPSKIVDEGFSYSARGELTDVYESTPHSGGYYHTSTAYWANGVVQSLSGVGQQSAYTYGVDGEGRPKTATQGSSNYVTGTTYNTASQPLVVSLKLGDSDSYTYDPNTGRMTNFTFTVGSAPKSMVGNLTWNANGSLRQLAITDGFNAAGTQTCNFGTSTVAGYDDLGRLLSANCGSVWSQNFSYNDAFGNITKSGSSSWLPGYNSSNRYTLAGTSYDNNGNLLNDTFHAYTWDSDGNTATIDTTTVTFDALDRVVEKSVSGTISEIEYSPIGKVAVMNGTTQLQAYVPLPGGEMLSPGPDTFWHTDWLGTVRLASSVSARTITFDRAFAPFGEMYDTVTGGTSNPNYTGDTQDTISGEYDTPIRKLHPGQGRWISPDPAGVAAVDPTNPQSWNRYAYVVNNPLDLLDPLGTCYLGVQVDTTYAWTDENGTAQVQNKQGPWAYQLLYPGPCLASPCLGGGNYFVSNGGVSCGTSAQIQNFYQWQQQQAGSAANNGHQPAPEDCRYVDPLSAGIEITGKVGPGLQVGPVDAGLNMFTHTLGEAETGSSVELGFKGLLSLQGTRDNALASDPLSWSFTILGFRHSSFGWSFQPSKEFKFGLQAIVGFEIGWNTAKFKAQVDRNIACGYKNGPPQ